MVSLDDMMAGVTRLKQAGTEILWGPGRHTAGNNTFSYFTTPAGFAVEYTSKPDHVDFDTHEAKVHIPGPPAKARSNMSAPTTWPMVAIASPIGSPKP